MAFIWLGLHIIGCLVVVGFIFLVIDKESADFKNELLLTAACCMVSLVAKNLYLLAHSQEALMVLAKVEYLGKCFASYYAFLFLLKWRRVNFPKILQRIMFAINLIAFCIIMTFDYHNLYYKNVYMASSNYSVGGYVLAADKAPFYNFYMGFVVLECILFIVVYIYSARKRKREFKGEPMSMHVLLIGSCLAPVLLLSLRVLHVLKGDDPTPLGLFVAVLLLMIAVIRGGLFDTVELAKENLIAMMKEGIYVIDQNRNFLYSNPAGEAIYQEVLDVIGKDRIFETLHELYERKQLIFPVGEKEYKCEMTELLDGKKVQGYVIYVVDVTFALEQNKIMKELKDEAESANLAKSLFISNMSHEIRTPLNAIIGMTEIMLRGDSEDRQTEYLMNIKSSGDALLTIINDILDLSKVESGKMEIVPTEYKPMSMINDLGMIFLSRIGERNIELLFDIDPQMPTTLQGDAVRIRQIIINLVNNAIKFTEEGFVKLTIDIEEKTDDQIVFHVAVSDTGQGIREEDLGKLFQSFQQLNLIQNATKEGTGLGLAISKMLVELMGGSIHVESKWGEGSTFFFDLPQKVLDSTPEAALKEISDPSEIWISSFLSSTYSAEALRKLVGEYGLSFMPYEQLEENGQQVDYLFADLKTYEEIPVDYAKELCIIQNPLLENRHIDFATMVNSPLFSLNLCQIINHESMHTVFHHEEKIMCTAPDAKVLLVDDSEMNLKVAKGLLQPLELQIDTAMNGLQALEMVQQMHYDLVLMDHMMPVMDGVEATKKIRALKGEEYQRLPIIALTANALLEERERFAAAGMNDFAAKPIETNEIFAKILSWLPEELVQKGTSCISEEDTKGEEKAQSPHEIMIEGLDVQAGITNCGSEEMFLQVLGDFYELIDMKSACVEDYLKEHRLRDYTVEVHALKTNARMIGSLSLSKKFLELEQLGNAEQEEMLKEKTPGVLEEYRSLKKILKPYRHSADGEKTKASKEEILQALKSMSDAVEQFDLDGVDSAMEQLRQYEMPEVCTNQMKQLAAYVADVAMDDILILVEEIKQTLQKQ